MEIKRATPPIDIDTATGLRKKEQLLNIPEDALPTAAFFRAVIPELNDWNVLRKGVWEGVTCIGTIPAIIQTVLINQQGVLITLSTDIRDEEWRIIQNHIAGTEVSMGIRVPGTPTEMGRLDDGKFLRPSLYGDLVYEPTTNGDTFLKASIVDRDRSDKGTFQSIDSILHSLLVIKDAVLAAESGVVTKHTQPIIPEIDRTSLSKIPSITLL